MQDGITQITRKMAKKNNIPMYITSLELENIKCFGEKQVLKLTDNNGAISPWTLILGDNGFGKTTLLKCLAWMIPVEETDEKIKADAKITSVAIKPLMDDFERNSDYEHLMRGNGEISSRVGATLSNGGKLNEVPKTESLVSHAISFSANKKGELKKISAELEELKQFNSPQLYAYGAGRHIEVKNVDNSELKDSLFNLMSDTNELYDTQQLLVMLNNTSIRHKGKGKASEVLVELKRTLADILPEVENPDDIIVNPEINKDGSINTRLVEIKSQEGKVHLFNLSLGYKTMFAWIVDLAVRMLWNNPESKRPLEEPAIVLIDEIDLHLHPKWQRIIRKYLTEHFPNTQFICTAHSPFMAQSSELENLCVIKRYQQSIIIENEPGIVRGWRIGQIATSDLFGITSERSPDIADIIEERRTLLDKEKRSSKEEARLNDLDDQLSNLPVLDDDNQQLLEQIKKLTKSIGSR